jgi:RNA polymerase sigma factor (TIGR02999 family)
MARAKTTALKNELIHPHRGALTTARRLFPIWLSHASASLPFRRTFAFGLTISPDSSSFSRVSTETEPATPKTGGSAGSKTKGQMGAQGATGVTRLLAQWADGDRQATEELLSLVYDELRRLARSYLQRENPGHTLQSTALVHEAYLRLVEQDVSSQSRAHFFGIAAQMMRRILVDHARRRNAAKRDAERLRVLAGPSIDTSSNEAPDLLALDSALKSFERIDARQARIVELRFFAGLTVEETAEIANVSAATVKREWRTARAWLRHEIGDRPGGSDD